MKQLKDANISGKKYKDYFYTIKRLHNTTQGHPNYEIAIFKINIDYLVQCEIAFQESTYQDVATYVEQYIDKLEGGE